MAIEKLKKLLNYHSVRYRVIEHSPAFTAQEIAESAHESGHDVVKTVILKVDDQIVMYVLPADKRLDIKTLRGALEAYAVELAEEDEFKALFPDCLTGAIPPFGGLYNVKMIVDKSLWNNEWIVFNAGNHHELIKMRYQDFDEIIHPHKFDYISVIV